LQNDEPSALTYPALQVLHSPAPALLKVPAAQLSQVALPVELAWVPAVHAMQSEASSAS
jgi:hypothetical protein